MERVLQQKGKRKYILFFETRNFGDAIIKNDFIKKYGQANPVDYIDILCKKQFVSIFEDNPYIQHIYTSGFPIAGMKSWNFLELLGTIRKLHGQYDLAVDVLGDWRERLLLWMMHPRKILSLERAEGHPFNNLIRRGLSSLVEPVPISLDQVNFYRQLDALLVVLGGGTDSVSVQHVIPQKTRRTIGIHPLASQECKLWGWASWNELIRILKERGDYVWCFCAPKEKAIIEKHIEQKDIQTISSDIKSFFRSLSQVDLLICLDSFATHAAYSVGVPSIVLNGANDFRLWQTPLTKVVQGAFECKYWPCYNKPKCTRYDCMASIRVEDVIHLISDEFS
jgi:hypothetical protein